jgi:hypothetical protein
MTMQRRGTQTGNIWQNVAVCSRFGLCEDFEITRSSRKLPDCDNSWAQKAVNRNAAGAETGALAAAAAIDLDFQIADFLSQGVAVNPQ